MKGDIIAFIDSDCIANRIGWNELLQQTNIKGVGYRGCC